MHLCAGIFDGLRSLFEGLSYLFIKPSIVICQDIQIRPKTGTYIYNKRIGVIKRDEPVQFST